MNPITISQGLRRIKAIKGELAEATTRAASAVRYEELKVPAFRFKEQRERADKARKELLKLESAVAKANAITLIPLNDRKVSIAEAVRTLQEFKAEIAWLQSLSLNTESRIERESQYDAQGRVVQVKTEFKVSADLTEIERDTQIKSLKSQFEALNDALEKANHITPMELGD